MVIKKDKKVLIKKKILTKKVGVKKVSIHKEKISKKPKINPKSKIKKISVRKNILKKSKSNLKQKKTDEKIPIKKLNKEIKLVRSMKNPILEPRSYSWESQASFNPGAIYLGGKVHLFYRALGDDGISRIGYASSLDGINFDERLVYPVYFIKNVEDINKNWPYTSPAHLTYNTSMYSSGGGWGGCEDPRVVKIGDTIYITFNVFDGTNGWKWDSMRVAVVCIKEDDLLNKRWKWQNFSYLSHLGDRQKNWVLFPEKFNNKFAIFHNLDKGDPDSVFISYVDKLNTKETPTVKDAPDPQVLPDHIVAWHKRTRSASAPPIKTKDGWLLLYHAMDKENGNQYKLGAMLLDLKDPSKVLFRAQNPILEPGEWYENDWKPGIIYASGAIVKGDELLVYYGGGDKYIGVASIKLPILISAMKENRDIKLIKNKKLKLK